MRRIGLLTGVCSLAMAACSGSAGTSSASAEIELRAATPPTPAEEVDRPTIDIETAGIDRDLETWLVDTQAELYAVQAECSANPGRVQPSADFSNRTFSGPDLRCADLTGASFRGAVLEGVDLTGANLDGVIGADFSRAKNVPPKYLKD